MKKLILAASMLACSLSFAKDAPKVYGNEAVAPATAEERQIAGLFDVWNAALATGKPSEVLKLYHPKATLLPTVSNRVRATPDDIKDYFDHFLALKPQGMINYRNVQVLDRDTAIDIGVYTFNIVKEGKPSKVQARYSFVYEKVGAKWSIISHHSSAMPEQIDLD